MFYNTIDDMQREINLPGPIGVIQLIRNTADATITGLEVDGAFSLTDNFVLLASSGVIDSEYDEVKFDLNTDGIVDGADKALDLPRAADLTWSIGFTHDLELATGVTWPHASITRTGTNRRIPTATWASSRSRRSSTPVSTFIPTTSAGYFPSTAATCWMRSSTVAIRNCRTSSRRATGGTFSPLAKGRVYGAEVTFSFQATEFSRLIPPNEKTVTILTSDLVSLRKPEQATRFTQRRNYKTQRNAVRNICSSWLKQGDHQD